MDTLELLHTPIPQLAFSEAFIRNSVKMGYETIGEMLLKKPEVLQAHSLFNYTWFGELGEFLLRHDLLQHLQPATGKSPL
jgi:hypothetical protein